MARTSTRVNATPFGLWLHGERTQRDLTQGDLSRLSQGVLKQSNVSAIERGIIADPDPIFLDAIAEVFSLSRDFVYEKAGRKVPDAKSDQDIISDPKYAPLIQKVDALPSSLRTIAIKQMTTLVESLSGLDRSQIKESVPVPSHAEGKTAPERADKHNRESMPKDVI